MSDVEATTVDPVRLVSVAETAGILGVKPSMVYEEIATGRLPCFRIGKSGWCIRISMVDVADWLEARRSTADRPIKPSVGPKPRSKPVRGKA